MSSSVPDSSPTVVIWIASLGKPVCAASACDSESPPFTASVAGSSCAPSSRLATTWRAMPSAASSDTPFLSIEPSVRIRRAVSTFSSNGPNTFTRNSLASNARRTSGSRMRAPAYRPATTSAASSSRPQSCRKVPNPISIRVMSGILTSMSWKIGTNCGSTNASSRINAPSTPNNRNAGYTSAPITLSRSLRARSR